MHQSTIKLQQGTRSRISSSSSNSGSIGVTPISSLSTHAVCRRYVVPAMVIGLLALLALTRDVAHLDTSDTFQIHRVFHLNSTALFKSYCSVRRIESVGKPFTNLRANGTLLMSLKKAGLMPLTFDPSGAHHIWYNRVPKTGSTTVCMEFRFLSTRNHFLMTRDRVFHRTYLQPHDLKHIAYRHLMNVTNTAIPILSERHLHFVDFASLNFAQPWYINVVRDPFERMVSWYYYRRLPNERRRAGLGNDSATMTFDECVLSNNSECTQPEGDSFERGYFKIIPYFCGQDDFCRQPTEQALAQAKANVERYYIVVGVTDRMTQFFAVLRRLLPQYFRSAFMKSKKMYATPNKRPVSEAARQIMMPKLQLEYELYEFVRRRFVNMCHLLNITIADTA